MTELNNALVKVGFSTEMQEKAKNEGWQFIRINQETENPEIVLDKVKINGQSKLRNVNEVYDHVIGMAAKGNDLYKAALEVLKVHNNEEYMFRMARFEQYSEEVA